jgi:hypothetical protein
MVAMGMSANHGFALEVAAPGQLGDEVIVGYHFDRWRAERRDALKPWS